MIELRVVKIGASLAVQLPHELINRLHLADGDRMILTESPEGGYRLTAQDPEFEQQMQAAEEGMQRYRNTLKVLAE
ncbi:MAG: AbrB/MazE/SpoVT family DNA-binding domain-containing protein [Lamprobacter sp.]|uniref:AbrB/MazE/SpoVT family DNA-binding domain-containing protein n=1 Tax=Lamprobacter sp. TaxID=3100796 RepID=UPI002B25DC67|nr:AbrB/MazE/SpoVT family DNA-binding domain-containing protein [Lamprobacter sp.]MEA3643600.1 AbrB/MazE/SpoVT family DNA-binding domain-containing protein [Lamprobacter sp.]